ncbi:helix-turn-helix domain-containing protein [Bradyrhizobium ottawaense]|uniref:Helix-turn-helix domain-containing protein n=1 Tax=Bradyrhizobium ottawaense TaxID=931866 RepID=A0A2U8P4S5_9BRAD|nr:helix-turn-helix domain-containing protein [Bradyrhizobium ottawaense]AWL92696.1 helix-turn-helix domain-containing protein [Bradyrhizobium ottawaense]
MNKLDKAERAKILTLLCEGMSIRAISRVTGAGKNTILRLLIDAGRASAGYQDRVLRNLPCKRVQVDEVWSFVRVKSRNVAKAKVASADAGDVWTWTALCADTKLLASFYVSDRSYGAAKEFIGDLSERLSHRIQLTSDGHKAYVQAVVDAFGTDIDYSMLIKKYGQDYGGSAPERRYSPAVCIGIEKDAIIGSPDMAHVSTSFVERQNLTMRMSMRRFTRLTNGFSKKIENHACAVALHSMFYNFVRVHQTLKTTPAKAAGVTLRVWTMADMVDMIEAWEAREARQIRLAA